jgi:LppP/LprE lipoprotein
MAGRLNKLSAMRLRRTLPMVATLALGTAVGALLGGCGGATKTVTAVEPPPAPTAATGGATTTTTDSTSTPPAAATTPNTTTEGGQSVGQGASATRTAPEPAFTRQGTGPGAATGEAAAAVAVVKAHGYTPDDISDYHSNQTLRVLVGTRTGSGDGYDRQAFFFVDGSYIGTDASQPSATLRVVSQSDTEVILAYPLYRPHDPLCCPGGGQATVHFALNDGRLVALDPIPPVTSQTGTSRQ